MNAPKLFLTSMSGPGQMENIVEMIEPIAHYLDGIVWVLHDCPADDSGARYLERMKGAGRVIHRAWAARHWHSMNETLFTGLIAEGDLVIWTDPLERPMEPFVSRIKSQIGPMMTEAEVGMLAYYGKAFLFPYVETLEYRQSPHWTLTGWQGRAIDWSTVEPDEKQVRLNVRPAKRQDPLQWIEHYARYHVCYPAGSNTCALGLDHFPPGDRNQQFAERETRRLQFRRLMLKRGFPLTLDGLKACLTGPLDAELIDHLRSEKSLSDAFHYYHGRGAQLKHSHNPADALPIS